MSEEELAIWRAAYGAAFAVDFEAFRNISDFDRASASTNAENASYVADCAIARLREWRAEEEPEVGVRIRFDPTELESRRDG